MAISRRSPNGSIASICGWSASNGGGRSAPPDPSRVSVRRSAWQHGRGRDAIMNDMPTTNGLDGRAIADLGEQLNQLLRLRTFPIGMKLFEDVAEMEAIAGLRRPARGKTYSTCQLVTQSRMAGFTLGITTENVPPFSSCSSVIGLDAPGEIYTSGRKMEGVWFENREA